MELILGQLNRLIWGPGTLILFIATGLFFTIRLRFLPWKNLGYALKLVFKKEEGPGHGDISPFQSLMTSLAACIGTGNIVGVASAMVLGGPGALVWMCLSAFLGLSTIFAESVLSVKHRELNSRGEMCGGPMYVMKNGLGGKSGALLGCLFAIFTVGASFGMGNMTQANSVSGALKSTFNIPEALSGAIIVLLAMAVLLGGIQSIGKVCGFFVPAAAIFYIGCALAVIFLNYANIGTGLASIFKMAFSVRSVAGGVGGTITASVFTAMKWGIARGVFSNEAGLGSAPIAAAAARTDAPSRQGYLNMTGTFFDTIVMCSITGLAIAASGVLGTTDSAGHVITGIDLTICAFESVLGSAGRYIITIGIICFALPTIIGWEYYGEKALEYLVKNHTFIKIYRVIFCLTAYVGATKSLQLVWDFSDAMNGLMAVPNIISLWLLNREIAGECFDYEQKNIKKQKNHRKLKK